MDLLHVKYVVCASVGHELKSRTHNDATCLMATQNSSFTLVLHAVAADESSQIQQSVNRQNTLKSQSLVNLYTTHINTIYSVLLRFTYLRF